MSTQVRAPDGALLMPDPSKDRYIEYRLSNQHIGLNAVLSPAYELC